MYNIISYSKKKNCLKYSDNLPKNFKQNCFIGIYLNTNFVY